jgi:hypothetical protein
MLEQPMMDKLAAMRLHGMVARSNSSTRIPEAAN